MKLPKAEIVKIKPTFTFDLNIFKGGVFFKSFNFKTWFIKRHPTKVTPINQKN